MQARFIIVVLCAPANCNSRSFTWNQIFLFTLQRIPDGSRHFKGTGLKIQCVTIFKCAINLLHTHLYTFVLRVRKLKSTCHKLLYL